MILDALAILVVILVPAYGIALAVLHVFADDALERR
jgi:hypothetical protein